MFQGQFLVVKYLGHNIDMRVTNEWMKLKAMVQYPPVVVLGLAKQSNSHDYNKPEDRKHCMSIFNRRNPHSRPQNIQRASLYYAPLPTSDRRLSSKEKRSQ